MRKLFYLLAVVSAALLIYSAVRLFRQPFNRAIPHLGEVKGFDDSNEGDQYKQLLDKFGQRIKAVTDQAEKDQTVYFWLSFLVTALTAGSTLISSVEAARKDSPDNPRSHQLFAVLIAVLTFCSTLANFGSSHFNDRKTDETKKSSDLITLRNQFFADYDKAPADGKPLVIQNYGQRLN